MRLRTRSESDVLPGLTGTVRVGKRVSTLVPRVRKGDFVLIDLVDMDQATATSLVAAGAAAVLNVQPMVSGRFPNRGPQVLVDAGVPIIDELGDDVRAKVRDGATLRLHEGALHLKDETEPVATGRQVDAPLVATMLQRARDGLTSQLDTFTHNASEFLRREQDLLLHGRGVPDVEAKVEDRPVVVMARTENSAEQLNGLKRFLTEQRPVLIAVDRAADDLLDAGRPADIIVIGSGIDTALPSTRALKEASDVIAVVPEGISKEAAAQLDRLGVRPRKVASRATAEDVALLIADRERASVIVGVGVSATLPDFLDRQRAGLASTYLTRLKVGGRLVDATAVPTLYSGSVRPVHLVILALVGLLVVLAAIAVTPAGEVWAQSIGDAFRSVYDNVRGNS